MTRFRNHIVTALCLFLWFPAQGQTKVHVITKTVEKSFVPDPGHTLKIEGESAKIKIESWTRQDVKVVMNLISKGVTKPVAEKELSYQKYAIDDIKDAYTIRNFLLVPKGLKELSTIQQTEITVWAPQNLTMAITNSFGEIQIDGYDGQINITSEYTDIQMKNTSGKLTANCNFGDLSLVSFSGELRLNLIHTETSITSLVGKATIETNLGDVAIKELGLGSSLYVSGIKSDITLSVKNLQDFYWSIRSKYGELKGPTVLTSKVQSIKNLKVEYGDPSRPQVRINTDFGEIAITDQ